ncbi:hypothetical protein AB9P05_00470 [Roseivirga sp. BDSF3-8]|uniref:hypothetical protein n=1 Tax=Roseivirga sp. BDSF3-8 TaxID=3241598 RepID=UPI0035320677
MWRLLLIIPILAVSNVYASGPFSIPKDCLQHYILSGNLETGTPDSLVLYVINGIPYESEAPAINEAVAANRFNPTLAIQILKDLEGIGCRRVDAVVLITYTETNEQSRSGKKAMLDEVRKLYRQATDSYPALYINDHPIAIGKVLTEINLLNPRKVTAIRGQVCKDNSGSVFITYNE